MRTRARRLWERLAAAPEIAFAAALLELARSRLVADRESGQVAQYVALAAGLVTIAIAVVAALRRKIMSAVNNISLGG